MPGGDPPAWAGSTNDELATLSALSLFTHLIMSSTCRGFLHRCGSSHGGQLDTALVIRVRVRVTHGPPRTPRACAAPRPSHTALRATTELSVYALLRADYQQQHAARSELSGDPAPAPCSATVPREPPGTHDLRLRRCPQGNTYNTPGGTNSNGGSSYHYSNSNGSYYYANDNGSTYYQPPPSSSAPPVYTPAPPSK